MDQINSIPASAPPTPTVPNRLLPILLTTMSIIFLVTTLFFAFQTINLQNQLNSLEKSIHNNQIIPSPTTSPIVQPKIDISDWQTYSNSDLSFQYPPDFNLQPAPESNLVMSSWGNNSGYGVAKISHSKTGHYNLESIFTISKTQYFDKKTNANTTESKCYQPPEGYNLNFSLSKTINGVIFRDSNQYNGAGAGNHYFQRTYRTYINNYCWDITLTNHNSSDWNNVDTNETDKLESSTWSQLIQILNTTKFNSVK